MRIIFPTLIISGTVAAAILVRAERMGVDTGLDTEPRSTVVATQPARISRGPATYSAPRPATAPETDTQTTVPDAQTDPAPAEKHAYVQRLEELFSAGRSLISVLFKTDENGEYLSNEERFNAFVETQRDKLPIRVNGQMQLTDISAAEDTISFFYVIELDGKNVNRQSLKAMQPQLEGRYCNDPRLAPLRRLGLKATYIISDIKNRPLYRFFMDPARCA